VLVVRENVAVALTIATGWPYRLPSSSRPDEPVTDVDDVVVDVIVIVVPCSTVAAETAIEVALGIAELETVSTAGAEMDA